MATSEQWTRAREDQRAIERVTADEARVAMGAWVASLAEWRWLVTHTYDHEKVARRRLRARGVREPRSVDVDRDALRPLAADVAWSHWRRWVGDVARHVSGPVYAFAALEPHKSGWPHFHTVMQFDARAVDEVSTMHGAWFDAHGFIRCDQARDQGEVAAYYATKLAGYTTKQLGDGVGWLMSRELVERERFNHDVTSVPVGGRLLRRR